MSDQEEQHAQPAEPRPLPDIDHQLEPPPMPAPYFDDGTVRLYQGDTLAVLRSMPTASVDACVTDPPYSSGGLMRSDRNLKTSAKYVLHGTDVERPEFYGDNRDQRAFLAWSALWMAEAFRELFFAIPDHLKRPGVLEFIPDHAGIIVVEVQSDGRKLASQWRAAKNNPAAERWEVGRRADLGRNAAIKYWALAHRHHKARTP